ncbi:hypothetical protein K1T71_000620 [Dendrolimus kikuchii]|uniref:Uncharacterized protein n=1 Tax=Dendrolimus kikuchii TaxID=765133 RepID=A0ACC1DKM1_9NEOP|nr:hypothetical protein K1T71_000620 [Dendrolimus kikuchii]
MSRCDFKIVLLGSEHVGKTSLVLRFVNCRFNADIPYQNTVGAAFCAKTMQSNGKDFNVGIWDTAGSERYEAMTKIYYRGAHAAIICYEPSSIESWNRLRHWLLELRTVEENCKVYLCGTKKDLLDGGNVNREVPEDIVKTYSLEQNGHFLTSSKTGENVAWPAGGSGDPNAARVERGPASGIRCSQHVFFQAFRGKNKEYCLC